MAFGVIRADGDFVDGFVAHGGELPEAQRRNPAEVGAAQEKRPARIQEAAGQAQGAGEAGFLERLGGIHHAVLASAFEQQQQRLKAVIEKQIPKSIEFLPEIYVQDKNGVRELLSGSVIA